MRLVSISSQAVRRDARGLRCQVRRSRAGRKLINFIGVSFALLAILTNGFMLTGCSVLEPPADWSGRDTALEVGYQLVNAIDYRQTRDIQHHPNISEFNNLTLALVGNNPSNSETATVFATYALSHYLIAKSLPRKWRPWFQGGTLALSASYVAGNCDLDLFCF